MTKGKPADSLGGQLGIDDELERPWHTLLAEEVAQALQTDPTSGLTNPEAARRRKQFGPNALVEAKGRSILSILVDQFKSLIVALLVGATVVAFALGENIEAVAVLVVIVLNAAVGFLTEWKAEQALTALQQQAVPTAHVLREVEEHEIPAAELVQPFAISGFTRRRPASLLRRCRGG